jgi:hypothetical protein
MIEPALPEASPGPARPDSLTVDFYEQADSLVIHKRRAGGPWVFLLLWLIGWTVVCAAMLGNVIMDPSLGIFAFALPFWASWLFIFGMLVWMMFGRETLFLGHHEAIFLRRAFIQLSSRVVPREEVLGFRECRSNFTENDEYLWGIEMFTLGKPVRFAFRLPDRERAWLIHQLNRFLVTSDPEKERHILQPGATITRSISSGETSCSNGTLVATEVLAVERTLTEPPTDSRWHVTEDDDTFAFWHKGRLNIGALVGLLFINAFWNGIVSVFVMVLFGQMPINNAPQGWHWWGIFVFLIPFEGIGLAMFAALILAVLEPFRRTSWRFEQDRLVSQTCWPGYCHTRAWDAPDLDRLELRRRNRNDSKHQLSWDMATDLTNQLPFELALVSSTNVDLCNLGKLTEGEARWMARIVLDRRPKWFASFNPKHG